MTELKEDEINNTESKTENPFISVEKIKPDLRKKDPPLVDVIVSNPITYIKSWWKKVIGNEGMEIRIKIKPLTAILITVIVVSLCLGITKLNLPFQIPFLAMNGTPSPRPEILRQTAFAGVLRYSLLDNKYYLETNSSEAINLDIPSNINLDKFIGRRIFATGKYSELQRNLIVSDVSDLEIFPEVEIPIPTLKPTLTPIETVIPEPTVIPSEIPSPTSSSSIEPSPVTY